MKNASRFGWISGFTLLLLWAFTPIQQTDWTEYSVVTGSHDFKPNEAPLPFFGANTYTADLSFAPSCWWSAEDEDYSGGRDIRDWNKIGGMTNYFNANSTHSVLLAWRPAPSFHWIEITAYINPKEGRFVSGPVLSIPVDTPVHAQITWLADTVRFEYGDSLFVHPLPKPWAIRKVGPWFGGNQTAHRDMSFRMEASLQ